MSHVREEALLLGRLVVQRVGEPMVGVVDLGREEYKIREGESGGSGGDGRVGKGEKVCVGKGIEGERGVASLEFPRVPACMARARVCVCVCVSFPTCLMPRSSR